MEKIKLVCDTACDIPDKDLKEYGIDMLSVPIAIDGEGYYERKSFGIAEFYTVLAKSKEIPTTSRVPSEDYVNSYRKAYEEGYTDLINVTINSTGSGTNASAQMARDYLLSEQPEIGEKMNIHIVDSRTYSVGYGYPIIQAAKMAHSGSKVDDILAYLDDWFSRAEVYLGCYTLEYAKKSGRINAAAAFVGDVLGLRPVISMIDGTTKVVDKVRGDRQLVPRLISAYQKSGASKEDPVVIVYGDEESYGRDLQAQFEKELGRTVPIYQAGASIAINAGPKIAAFVCLAPKRRG